MNTKAIAIQNIEQKIILVLGSLLLMQALMYVYFVNSTIFNVVARKESEEIISTTETEITGLVSEYMALSEKINLDLAYTRGFVDAPANGIFVVAKPEAVALSFDNGR
ncbi:MAG: hypothetical protein AAB821_02425 [Patescibacteria group bacterium]